jgi:hypothetical protein
LFTLQKPLARLFFGCLWLRSPIEGGVRLRTETVQVQPLSQLPFVRVSIGKMPNKRKTRRVKIVERKLGRERAWGLYYHGENLIELDERMKSRHHLSVLIHEAFHHLFPWMSEPMVKRTAPKLAKVLWAQNYRRIAK